MSFVTKDWARRFAQGWIKAWNTHDIEAIMAHYAREVTVVSPVAGRLLGCAEVKGKDAVKDYFIKGLHAYPDLAFRLLDVLIGWQSVVLYYLNQNGVKAAEFMRLDDQGKVVQMVAHYGE